MYYLTIGYPLGSDIVDNKQIYQVSVKSRILRLFPIEYMIWGRFLLGAYVDDVENTLTEQEQPYLAPIIQKLVQNGLLIGFPEGDFAEMNSLIFMRQGIGIGCDGDSSEYQIMFKDAVSVNAFSYDVWRQADGCLTYAEIEQRMVYKYKCQPVKIQETIFKLCRKGLLLALNRK